MTIPPHASSAEPAHLQVYIRNDARVPDDTLAEALRLVTDVFRHVGMGLSWTLNDPMDDAALTIALRPRASRETARRAPDALGYTPGDGTAQRRLAFVLIDRVAQVADGYRSLKSVVLGVAIAHELGHLLTSPQHSDAGVMKAYFNQTDFRRAREGTLRFTPEQSQHIRRVSVSSF